MKYQQIVNMRLLISQNFHDEEIGETQIVDMQGNAEVYVGTTDDERKDVCEDQALQRKSKRGKIVLKEIPKMEEICTKADCTHN